MPDKTYKKIELIGVSENSMSEAIQNAITKASSSIRNIDWFEVAETRGFVKDGRATFQVVVKIGFRLD